MGQKQMDEWLNEKGPLFLHQIGLKKGDQLLDFGCRHGTYSIPASIAVGRNGKVFALDKNIDPLHHLALRIETFKLDNITLIHGTEDSLQFLKEGMFDMILLYDVLHLINEKTRLLMKLYSMLRSTGLFSVYPRHHKEKMGLDVKEVNKLIESVGFHLKQKYMKTIMHDDDLVSDYIYTFKK